jgi:subtilisin family serine protease
MRRLPVGVTASLALICAVLLTSSGSTQGRRAREVQLVDGREAAAGEVLLRFRGGSAPSQIAEVRALVGADAVERIGRTGFLRIRTRSRHAAALAALFSSRPDVEYAEPNFIVRSFAPPNDPSFPQLWGLQNAGQAVNGSPGGTAGADIAALGAWDVSAGDVSPVVAVVDSGIDYTHPDLQANMWSAPSAFTVTVDGQSITCPAGSHGFDAIGRNCNPNDRHHHGTHVAGTIGAVGNNGIGVVGVNWTTRIMALGFLDESGSGTVADAIAAIEFAIETKRKFGAAADVRVLSNSWGSTNFSQALYDEILAANDEDMLFVAAAGNSGISNDLIPTYPASYDAPNIIAVAATTPTDQRAWFSNYGPKVHLGAPGVNILSTMPANSYGFSNGTSMATPHVSGAAVLVASRCDVTTFELKQVLLGTVDPVAALAQVTSTGGRLNAHSAIESCLIVPEPPANLVAQSGNQLVILTWSPSVGAIRHTVKRSTSPGGPYVELATAVKAGSYTDTAVTNGTTYYYVVSAASLVGEGGPSNEASATPNLPSDLVVPTMTVPATGASGSPIDVSVTTTNQGTGAAGASKTKLYLSTNTTLDAADHVLGDGHQLSGLAPGGSTTTVLGVVLPPGLAAGRYYVVAKADADNVLIEAQENNNTRYRAIDLGADLVVSALTVPAAAGAGGTVSVTDTVRNDGAASAGPSTTRFYLSSNSTLSSDDELLNGFRTVPALNTGATSSGTTSVTIPASAATGTYYLIAKADADQTVSESQETDNTRSASVKIGSDLEVSALTAPATAAPGASIVASDTTKNAGGGASPATTTRFYLSSDSRLDGADRLLTGHRDVPALAGGGTSAGNTSIVIPSETVGGSYYLLAVADADDVAAEVTETDNVRSRTIRVGSDLRVSLAAVPSSIAAGAAVSLTDTVTNGGAGSAEASTTRFYLSKNLQLDAADLELAESRAVPALEPAASNAGTTSVVIPAGTAAGSYYIIAKTDADDEVAEGNESNNTTSRFTSIVP